MAVHVNPAVKSISAFFPCYNDAATIGTMVRDIDVALRQLVEEYEIIVVDDGSSDGSSEILKTLVNMFPLTVVTHESNRGYGAALISGFAAAKMQWVFYTDGDAQYNANEVLELVSVAARGVDLVQGVKIRRSDPLHRRFLGRAYHHFVRAAFRLRVHDTDCDFRLIRRSAVPALYSANGEICVELLRKLQVAGARYIEVPVHHFARVHGRSQFFRLRQLARMAMGLGLLWWRLMIVRGGSDPDSVPGA